MKICKYKNNNGDIIIFALVFMSIFLVMAGGLLGVVKMNRKFTLQKESQYNALEIAESGINYYHWLLAHNPRDYSDGNGEEMCDIEPPYTCGPYIHDHLDGGGKKIGAFELLITPPPAGSTIITIQSTGWTDRFPNVKRTISTRYGVPSLAEYSFLEDTAMVFSATSETWGKVHSNFKIEFNGTNHSTVESAKNGNGVTGIGGPQDLWHWPVPAIDFNRITQDLSLIRAEAIANGIYLNTSGSQGYHLVLKENETIDIYYVTRIYWYGDIREQSFLENRSLEDIHLIFVEDNLWIDGVVTNFLTIGSARFPDNKKTNTTIYIPDNITYASRDSSNILGLIAQKDIILTYLVPNEMTIDGHLIAQKGTVERPCYWFDYKDSLTIYGGIISKEGGGFKCAYEDGYFGFKDTYYYSNPNAIYYPPPMFPISSTSTLISWEELE